MDNLCKVMNRYGATLQETYEVISHISKIPFTETDIVLIRNNPSYHGFRNGNWLEK